MTPRFLALKLNSRVFVRPVITQYHRLGSLNNKDFFPHHPRGWKSKIKVSTALVFSEASPWLAHGYFLTVSSCGTFCVHIPGAFCLFACPVSLS